MWNSIVPEHLATHNYENWRIWMKNYLLAHDLWDIVEETTESPNSNQAEFKEWKKKNAAALHAIHISCSLDVFLKIKEIDSAGRCWNALADIKVECIPKPEIQSEKENVYLKFRPLCLAIENGDCEAVKEFLKNCPEAVRQKLTNFGDKALHLAAFNGNVKVVQELVELMKEEDLETLNNNKETALNIAAGSGILRLAECMINKNKKLACVTGTTHIPVNVACSKGHRDMTYFLYSVTPLDFLRPEAGAFGSLLLHEAINNHFFDIALDLVQHCPLLAITRNHLGTTPLIELSCLTRLFPESCRLSFWQRRIYSCINVHQLASSRDVRIYIPQNGRKEDGNFLKRGLNQLRSLGSKFLELSGIKQIYDLKLIHTQALQLLDCICGAISTLDDSKVEEYGIYEVYFIAIQNGIIEIVTKIIKAHPPVLIVKQLASNRNILSTAVMFRQEKVFSLVYGLDTRKNLLLVGRDNDRNNMLHMAAMLAPPNRLARISGAALQMQRELQWYKEVESILKPSYKEYVNKFGVKPPQLFTNTHKDLVTEGEKWMKETATSCTVVGALIITIMFTAAFTVPGGNIQETGYPMFLHEKAFKVFIIADAISLFSSSTSVLMFLGILTSRYSEDDFLKSLPTKLIIGLSTLFFSIATMMVAFCATLILMLEGELNLIIPLVLLASIPVTLFIFLQFPLLVEIFISTYGPGIFDRKSKYLHK
ncbi:uncharacterized protein LOC110619023 [Manihot esculenta]|uniref:Uncharacterized protein n=1 Tax=Manihot esculenta TaxID=3983 RepID=A0ACB7HFK6_MANES|nr:uncharacterized protein LOC110619023 [Manihot esculenta]KAG8651030.1 hypothetical protein MANES_07G087101v8 [Manihot esculenta]